MITSILDGKKVMLSGKNSVCDFDNIHICDFLSLAVVNLVILRGNICE